MGEQTSDSGRGTRRKTAPRLASVLFALLWTALSVVFLLLIGRSALSEYRPRRWVETPCTFLSADVVPDSDGYCLKVLYRYQAGGKARTSSRYAATLSNLAFDSVSKQRELLERFGPGKEGVCRVDPDDPMSAVLVCRPLWGFAGGLAMAAFFTCIGIGIVISAIRGPRPKPQPTNGVDAPPPRQRLPGLLLPGLGVVFLITGVSTGIKEAIPFSKAQSITWQTTTAVVKSVKLKSHQSHGKNGSKTVYAPDIVYAYSVGGTNYENAAYSLQTIYTSSHSAASQKARRYPLGGETAVFYNPENPAESFLVKPSAADLATLLFPLLFALVGVGLLCFSAYLLLAGRRQAAVCHPLTGITLKRSVGKEGGQLGFFLVWTAFSLVFTAVWFTQGEPFSWTWQFWTFEKFFVLLFPAIGLGMLAHAAVRLVRHAAAGHYEITVAGHALAPGERIQLSYRFAGNAEKIDKATFWIVQQDRSLAPVRDETAETSGMELREEIHAVDNPALTRLGSFVFTMPEAMGTRRAVWYLAVEYRGLTDTFKLPVGRA